MLCTRKLSAVAFMNNNSDSSTAHRSGKTGNKVSAIIFFVSFEDCMHASLLVINGLVRALFVKDVILNN